MQPYRRTNRERNNHRIIESGRSAIRRIKREEKCNLSEESIEGEIQPYRRTNREKQPKNHRKWEKCNQKNQKGEKCNQSEESIEGEMQPYRRTNRERNNQIIIESGRSEIKKIKREEKCNQSEETIKGEIQIVSTRLTRIKREKNQKGFSLFLFLHRII